MLISSLGKFKPLFIVLVSTIVITGCDGDDVKEPQSPSQPGKVENNAPVVNAGVDQEVLEKSTIVLSGSAVDSDGEIKSYRWRQVDGPSAVELTNPSSPATTFVAPAVTDEEVLEFSFTAVDNSDLDASDTIKITVLPENSSPVVHAGEDRSVQELTLVTLQGLVEDIDGEITAYKWSQESGTQVQLLDIGDVAATFTAPVLQQAETLVFELSATDNEGATEMSSVKITIEPAPTKTISGTVEKGPYALGSQLTFSLLFDDGPTSLKRATAAILDDLGNYTIDVNETGLYSVEAKGHFHSELDGLRSESPLILRSVLDVSGEHYNINVLTHITNLRILWLLRVDSLSAGDAIAQAEEELKISLSNVLGAGPAEPFSKLSLYTTETSVGSDYLLALASLITSQANSNVNETTTAGQALQFILDTLEQDFASDGLLDNSLAILSGLQDAMKQVNPTKIQESLAGFIVGKEGYASAVVDNVLDTDLDGILNTDDEDDDNDNLLDADDPAPYKPSFLVLDQDVMVNEDDEILLSLETNNPNGGSVRLEYDTRPSDGWLSGAYPNITYEPRSDFSGQDSFSYYLTQDDIVSETVTINITITEVNDPPEIWGNPAAEAQANEIYSFTPGSDDEEDAVLTFSVENLPEWASFNSETGEISGQPTNAQIGNYDNIIISVTDNIDTEQLNAFSITVQANPYSFLASMPMKTRWGAAVEFKGKMYFFGGLAAERDGEAQHKDVFVYDIEQDKWEVEEDMPESSFILAAHVVGDLIYVFGAESGDALVNFVYAYNPEDKSWTALAPRPQYNVNFSSAAVGEKIYIIGGVGMDDDGPLREGEDRLQKDFVSIYDTTTNTWSQGTTIPILSSYACAVAEADKIYLIGGDAREKGEDGERFVSDRVYVYDTNMDAWGQAANMLKPRESHTCAKVGDEVYIFGGHYIRYQETVERYRIADDAWSNATEMDYARYWLPAIGYEGKAYLFGGIHYWDGFVDHLMVFDPVFSE